MPDALAPTNPYHTDFSHSKILFLLSHIQDRFANSARNLPNVEVELVDDIDVYPLLQGDKIVMDLKAVELLDEWLGNTRAPSSFSPDFVEDYLHEEELGARQLEGEELGKNMKEINYASVNGPSSQTLVERMGPVLAATAMSLAEARH